MKKIILINGLIAGGIVGAMMMITMPLYENGTLHIENGEWLGYSTMVIALSSIFFGIKSYRDQHSNGAIGFWGGVRIGLLITLVASLIYALSWEITRNNMKGDLMKMMNEKHMEKVKASGATGAEMAAEKEKMDSFLTLYQNPFFRFSITMIEIAPVGIVITFLSAALLRRKEFLPVN